MSNKSKVIKSANFHWKGIPRKDYKTETDTFKSVHRYNLLGMKEEEQALNFETRYFEVRPDGYTSFEYHRHPHSVVIIRGSGTLILGNQLHNIHTHDVIYIAPETPHQFHADHNRPLGFICVVDRYRDRPTLPDDEYITEHITNPEVKAKIRR